MTLDRPFMCCVISPPRKRMCFLCPLGHAPCGAHSVPYEPNCASLLRKEFSSCAQKLTVFAILPLPSCKRFLTSRIYDNEFKVFKYWVLAANGIVGKAYRHEIGFFTTTPSILIFFLKPKLITPLHMCPNRYILLLIVYSIFSVFKACLNTY